MALIEDKKNYHHGHLKEQLLEAVRQLVEEQGPDAFSIAEACRRAGVSTAAPYKHFKDRDEILHGVVLSAMHRMGAAMQNRRRCASPGDLDRIVALGKAYIDFARAEPGIFALMFGLTGSHADDPALTEEGQGKFEIVCRVVAEHLRPRPITPRWPQAPTRCGARFMGTPSSSLTARPTRPRSAWMKTPIFALWAVPTCPRSAAPPDQVGTGLVGVSVLRGPLRCLTGPNP
jgi:AcrR family transcriptional regulator